MIKAFILGCPASSDGLSSAVCDLRRRSKDTERTLAELARRVESVARARDTTGLEGNMVDIIENGEQKQWIILNLSWTLSAHEYLNIQFWKNN